MGNDKEKIIEAKQIAARFHKVLGYHVVEDLESSLALRSLVKKIEKEAVKRAAQNIPKNLKKKIQGKKFGRPWHKKAKYKPSLRKVHKPPSKKS